MILGDLCGDLHNVRRHGTLGVGWGGGGGQPVDS